MLTLELWCLSDWSFEWTQGKGCWKVAPVVFSDTSTVTHQPSPGSLAGAGRRSFPVLESEWFPSAMPQEWQLPELGLGCHLLSLEDFCLWASMFLLTIVNLGGPNCPLVFKGLFYLILLSIADFSIPHLLHFCLGDKLSCYFGSADHRASFTSLLTQPAHLP